MAWERGYELWVLQARPNQPRIFCCFQYHLPPSLFSYFYHLLQCTAHMLPILDHVVYVLACNSMRSFSILIAVVHWSFQVAVMAVGKTRNEMKRNGSRAHNNCNQSLHMSDRCTTISYISYPELIQYQVRLYIYVRLLLAMILRAWGRESWLFSQRPRCTRRKVCFAGKLHPMAYAPSHTQSGYIHNLRVSLANWWPLALSY